MAAFVSASPQIPDPLTYLGNYIYDLTGLWIAKNYAKGLGKFDLGCVSDHRWGSERLDGVNSLRSVGSEPPLSTVIYRVENGHTGL